MLELRNDKPIASLAPQVAQDIRPLRGEHEAEVLDFLSAHPLLTFVMTGWIKDNGLVSELNRGTFYASRNGRGELDGVALIGHVTLVETNSEASMSRFAELTRNCPSSFVVMGEERRIDQFMKYLNPDKPRSNQGCRELLFEQRSREHCETPMPSLRRATLDEVNLVAPVHAQMAFEESGVNPLEVDAPWKSTPRGFEIDARAVFNKAGFGSVLRTGNCSSRRTSSATWLRSIISKEYSSGRKIAVRDWDLLV